MKTLFKNALLPLSIALAIPSAAVAETSLKLEEIVVTAQKRAESLQDAALAVSALSGSDISDEKIENVLGLQSMAPSLQVSTVNGTARVFIRGIGLSNFAPGGESSVALHVDGAVISRPGAQRGSFYDLERIEVLRGPQGSLYGRNATGGSINVITNKPTEEFESYLNVSVGNYNLVEVEGAVSGPIIADKLLGRLVVKDEQRDGFGTNLFTNEDIDDKDILGYRASLSYIGSEDFDAHLTFSHHEEDDKNGAFHIVGAGNPLFTGPELALGGEIASDPRDNNTESKIISISDIDSVTLELNVALNADISLKSLSNYLEFSAERQFDSNGTPVQYLTGSGSETSRQFSEELQLTWQTDQHTTLFGLYYFEETINGDNVFLGPPLFTDILMRPLLQSSGTQDSTSYAAFVNSTWNISDVWAVNAGLRYSNDEKSDESSRLNPAGIFASVRRDETWDAWTPKLTVEYTPSDNLFFYGTVASGYKAGVINVAALEPSVDPEDVISYELGMKSQWLDNRLQLNAALFHATIKDLQVQKPIDGILITVNAAEATTQGIELETIALLAEGLTVKFNAAYVDAKFDEFLTSNTTFAPSPEVNLKGNRLPTTPKWQGDISLNYEMPLTDAWSVAYRLQGVYTGERWFNEFQEDIAYQESDVSVNANILLKSYDDHWSINVWGRNLTDETVYSHVNVTSRIVGHLTTATFKDPRTFGLTVGYNF